MGAETSPEQQYSLRWNDFHSSILSSFRHLRDEEDFVDVTLACDGCSFTAHKVVLSACSPYFRKLLKANPCQHPIVILRDVQHKDMESLLRFMYNGEVHIGQEQLTDFLKTAQMLQVRGLADVPAGAASVGQRLTSTTTEDKISPNTSSSLPWSTEKREYEDRGSSPPPAKRARSSDRGEATPDRHRSPSRGNGDMQESLLGQALEGPTPKEQKMNSESSMQAHSTGEESNSSDTAMSDHQDPITPKTEISDYPMLDDHHPYNSNGGLMDQSRQSSFPGALLGLQGLGGLLPGPSGMHGTPDSFVSRRSLDMMRVRATDPRPCPKCGKIYRSAHTLRTHLEDKHTICPGYRCVLCGTVAKSRNSLHSHMSRQHRGISTKDLPVVPMPAPFDPELASKLLAKAGVKISAAELRARASPTGPRRSDVKLDAKSAFSGGVSEGGSSIGGDNDPEDLTTSSRYGGMDLGISPPLNHQNNYKFNRYSSAGQAVAAKSIDSIAQNMSKEPYPGPLPPPVSGANTTGSAILDTYLQFITENSLGMGMMSEQAAAAVHAAKLAQLNAMGLDKASQHHFLEKMQQQMQTANDFLMKRNDDIRRNENDIKLERGEEGESSGGEDDDYSDEEAEPEQLKASD
ncbi:protein abrupt-like isoform X1 [Coccinella septempunctata]|uniref:protein abrupt-like isoform X1 n=1 Tax=Coccinella septempunctata TaxID=41139 RepID=UPI001D0909F4|nr:protein abrupt-like isoform X1 [Coccinella septempunctata]XP_044752208.1 protein abrupt-like isoform X1 [Coccinella septempunctata]XP_044752209.1 protein abrupt-like isoform X1 [Coccinella septempunctata]XP_044752210.1 protein abrupt-like isoform X1 [Coccinella septempunctata]XP_044752211.1 protein abrupt-like isoform X1 [Coccinella septempunctata]XP_044752212.1 protein abrupt-like isoform X1 [Coccinella septempunctata]